MHTTSAAKSGLSVFIESCLVSSDTDMVGYLINWEAKFNVVVCLDNFLRNNNLSIGANAPGGADRSMV